jgi:hypothetical protein
VLRLLLWRGANWRAALTAAIGQEDVQAVVALLDQPGIKITGRGLKRQLRQLAESSMSDALLQGLRQRGM